MILWKNKALELQLYLKMKIGLFAVKKKLMLKILRFGERIAIF